MEQIKSKECTSDEKTFDQHDRFISMAKEIFDHYKKKFDYSAESMKSVDEICDSLRSIERKGYIPADQIEIVKWNMACVLGTYVGDTILKNKGKEYGLHWKDGKDIPYIRQKGKSFAFYPILKVQKRIENGEEDSIESYYRVTLMIARGDLDHIDESKTIYI